MKTIRYAIKTCCGDHMAYVDLRIPEGADPFDYRNEALHKSDYPNVVCGSCYDQAFHAEEVV